MGITVRLEVKSNRFPEIVGQMREKASAAVRATAFSVEGIAKTKVAVDTGNLKNSIQAQVSDDPLSAEVATNVEYAVYQEYGTYKMAAHPYMTPAAEAAFPPFVQAMVEIFE